MQPTDRRAYLETIAESSESDQVRLKALELLDRLDEREVERRLPVRRPEPGALAEPERLARIVELGIESGLLDQVPAYQARIEQRAHELVEEQAEQFRSRFEAVGEPETESEADATDEPSAPSVAASEPEATPRMHPIDEAALRIIADDKPPSPSSLLSRKSY